jgi:predicted RNA methylase
LRTLPTHLDENANIGDPNRSHYEPSCWGALRRTLRWVPFSSEDVFVDFGSGKGRIVYLAARYPLKKIIGVEVVESLNEIARENIRKNIRRLRCKDITLVTMDVMDFDVPDDMTIAYFFNPFVNTIFTTVMDNILRSLNKNPRTLWIIYNTPVDAVREYSRLRLIGERKAISVYRADPA